jgi:hypothetical protein
MFKIFFLQIFNKNVQLRRVFVLHGLRGSASGLASFRRRCLQSLHFQVNQIFTVKSKTDFYSYK